MIINTTSKFFWIKIQKNLIIKSKYIMILLLFITLFTSCNSKQNFELKAIKLNSGWGYTISNDQKIIIKQTIIPVISENKHFQTKKEALKVGKLVLDKLNKNRSPSVTEKDLILLSIKT
ncbi:MAG: DUF4907 domain-containing protein [Flavobacteriaceae bacterium]|nr:DUF4907 domain-containing protein [Flavobacteriaceae bacterium]